MSVPSLDVDAFVSRLAKLYASWEVRCRHKRLWCALNRKISSFFFLHVHVQSSGEEASQWNDADALAVIVGKDDVTYSKSTALHVCW